MRLIIVTLVQLMGGLKVMNTAIAPSLIPIGMDSKATSTTELHRTEKLDRQ